jgi:hypothetical protein
MAQYITIIELPISVRNLIIKLFGMYNLIVPERFGIPAIEPMDFEYTLIKSSYFLKNRPLFLFGSLLLFLNLIKRKSTIQAQQL